MSVNQDADFLKIISLVLGSLVAFTILIIIMANSISPESATNSDPLVVEQTKGRIMPVGISRVAQ